MTKKAVFVVSLIIALSAASARWTAEAATFVCRGGSENEFVAKERFEEQKPHVSSMFLDGRYGILDGRELGLPVEMVDGKYRRFCRVLLMSGRIVPSDVKAFKDWLRHEPYTHIVKVASPGGSIEAAIEIGRLIRARFMRVWAYVLEPKGERRCPYSEMLEYQRKWKHPTDDASIKERQKVCLRNTDCRFENRCCLSACVFILVGAAYRDAQNIGLHRPSVRDFSQRSYDDAKQTLSRGQRLIEEYLKEMEVSEGVLRAMMKIPPDEIRLLDWIAATALIAGVSADRELVERMYKRPTFQMAPSIYDWLRPKCSQYHSENYSRLDTCLLWELQKESIRRAKRLKP